MPAACQPRTTGRPIRRTDDLGKNLRFGPLLPNIEIGAATAIPDPSLAVRLVPRRTPSPVRDRQRSFPIVIGYHLVSLSEVDRLLLQRCLDGAPLAWRDLVDRFLGLVIHVANHTARSRGIEIDEATRDDLAAEVFLELLRDDFAVLRRFRQNCSLATYLTVIARRVIIRRLGKLRRPPRVLPLDARRDVAAKPGGQTNGNPAVERFENEEEVRQLLLRLDPEEANLVRMYHLEGKSYRQISDAVGLAENSVGPALSRARAKMREGSGVRGGAGTNG